MLKRRTQILALAAVRARRRRRTRARLHGAALRPRLSVFRSLRFTWAQLVDDDAGRTVWAGTTRTFDRELTKVQAARQLGESAARAALAQGIREVVFDRGSYRYHGRVQALADGARAGGLQL
jgi:large subunit ribosomal protein L18